VIRRIKRKFLTILRRRYGYEAGKPHEEMEVVFNLYRMTSNAVPIISVTPTTYSINQSSIFAPMAKHS
jgi:hypothetical protein